MASRFALGLSLLLQVSGALAVGPSAPPVQELVVATVNNDHMLTLQRMTRQFEQQAPGWRVRWVTMYEDRLRQAVTRDAATQSAQFDVVTVGSYEAQAWGDKGWLRALTPSADYRLQDILPRVREALTQGGQLHALPLLTQPDFDHLLWACDLNFVRGEDSLVRALWAGQPFVWQIYPQHDDAHHAKLDAFLDWLQAPPALRALHRAWNGMGGAAPVWPDAAALSEWHGCVQAARQRLLAQPDLASQLSRFAQGKR